MRATEWDASRPAGGGSDEGDDDDDDDDDDGLDEEGRVVLSRAAGVHAFAEMDALRSEGRFVDVALSCGDGPPIPCHRVVLCASSAYFRSLLVEQSERPGETALPMLATLSFRGVSAAVDYCYGVGVPVLEAPPRPGGPPLRTWRYLADALRALRHFKMGLAEEHVWRCCIRALGEQPGEYLLAVDLHGLADDFDCEPLKHRAWHAALDANPKAFVGRPLVYTAQAHAAEPEDVDDAMLIYPFDDDGADPEAGCDIKLPPYDAATVVGAWARKLAAIRDGLGPDPPSDTDDDDDGGGGAYGGGDDRAPDDDDDDDDEGDYLRPSVARSASPDSATSDQ